MTPKRFPVSDTKENHRVRVAREKRLRTRALLLDAVLAVYPGDDRGIPAVIDDVIRHAAVSRGTFYKYFPSLEHAVTELGAELANEMATAFALLYDDIDDPRLRSATGVQLFLSRAIAEPRWGAFVAHINHLKPENALMHQVMLDLTRGVETGLFTIRQFDVSADLLIGALLQGIRRLIEGVGSRRYVEAMAGMMLRSLGVPPAAADDIASTASARLHREAPDRLSWWKPFD